MHRNKLLALLHEYTPTTPETQASKQRIIDFVRAEPHCFERSLTKGHITASCWLVNKQNTHALLTHHAKLDAWLQLGGHCDGNSDVLAVALKEAQEESGIMGIMPVRDTIFDIDVHLIPETPREKAHYHYDIRFLLQVMSDETMVVSSESKALRWIPKDRHALPTDELSVVRMFTQWAKC